jgi:hypothetical protein
MGIRFRRSFWPWRQVLALRSICCFARVMAMVVSVPTFLMMVMTLVVMPMFPVFIMPIFTTMFFSMLMLVLRGR